MKLNKEIINLLKEDEDGLKTCTESIDTRVNEIYKNIFKINGCAVDYYSKYELCYDCGYPNEDIKFSKAFEEYYVYVASIYSGPNINMLHEINGTVEIVNLVEKFPKHWLFEDFEQELNDGLQKYNDLMEQKKIKYAATKAKSKEDKLKVIADIKSKLSKEELELISFKKK